MVGRDGCIVCIKTVRINSVYNSFVPVTTRQLSNGRPHIIDIGFALQFAQTAPVMSHDIFAYVLCQRTRLLYTSTSNQTILAT